MDKLLLALLLGIFLLPSTSAFADFEDTRRERDEKIIQENHNDPSLKPLDASKVPTGSVPGNPSEVPTTNRNGDIKSNNPSVNNPDSPDGRK
ncbi:MAG: hypothetical protein H0W84_11555 [Bacteroidetes bacterium]|nr:hypothetical protein [Bacteroidota bacterium]